jgi:hypothetical protein
MLLFGNNGSRTQHMLFRISSKRFTILGPSSMFNHLQLRIFLSKICTRIGSQHTRRNPLHRPSNSGIQSSQSILMKYGRQPTLFSMHLVSRIFYGGFIQKLFLSTKEIIHLLFAIIVQNQNQQFISFLNAKELFTSLN